MSIQWFPGHMQKARKEIEEVIPQVDVIIEVLDARIPFSSENPMISSLRGDKPCVKVLNKRDLADPELTERWIEHFEKEQGVKAIAITTSVKVEVNHEANKLLKDTIDVIKNDKRKFMLITLYQFIASILDDYVYSPNRTHVPGLSFPSLGSKIFDLYKSFFLNQIT